MTRAKISRKTVTAIEIKTLDLEHRRRLERNL